jgi:nucleotide-binding universal stress UspA family protein
VFDHVLVGIDEEPESLVAAAQARVLCPPGSRLELLAVAETYLAAQAGAAFSVADRDLYTGTRRELELARGLVEPDDARMVSGRLVDALCDECERAHASLVAVGVRPHGRLGALVFGGHDVEVLHGARCSVLIARPGWGPSRPDRIVVGRDGSPEAWTAESVARALAERLGCELATVVALGDEVDPEVLRDGREDVVLHPGELADAVGGVAGPGDLVVVGRTRRHGHGASLAERMTSAARCSVLVVRHREA